MEYVGCCRHHWLDSDFDLIIRICIFVGVQQTREDSLARPCGGRRWRWISWPLMTLGDRNKSNSQMGEGWPLNFGKALSVGSRCTGTKRLATDLCLHCHLSLMWSWNLRMNINTNYLLPNHYSPWIELFLYHFSLTEHDGEASNSMSGKIVFGIVIWKECIRQNLL